MNKPINVISLFDGMSCGQIALKELGIHVEKYYASEIDKHAIAQTQINFPNTIQLGDVEKWAEWGIDWANIDLVLAGSPCQGFSFAGKQLAFNDPRSKLFFVFVDILNHCKKHNPDVKFLLENVNMKRSHLQVISEYCGVFPVRINSNLVSAQNRDRFYWTNIRTRREGLFGEVYSDIPQPKDRGIFLRDILEEEVHEKYYLSNKMIQYFNNRAANFNQGKINIRDQDLKASTITAACRNLDISDNFIKIGRDGTIKKDQDKASCFTAGAHSGGNHSDMDLICVAPKGVMQLNPSKESGGVQPYQQNRIYDEKGKSPALLAVMTCGSHAILQRSRGNNKGGVFEGKTPTLSANAWEQNNLLSENYRIRRLTPTECARLQTVPSWYKWKCSDTQQYRMLGNGWTVEVIKHILSFLQWK